MINSTKANSIVKTLKELKTQMQTQNEAANTTALGSDALSDAISYNDAGKMSVNLGHYRKQMDLETVEDETDSAAANLVVGEDG